MADHAFGTRQPTTLVAGCAALHDLIAEVDVASPSGAAIARLLDGPGLAGRWVPGGSAPTVALAMAGRGANVALWHPLPSAQEDGTRIRLAAAGVDLTRAPLVPDAARCIVLRDQAAPVAWSSDAPSWDAAVDPGVLHGIDHLVICPRPGPWSSSLLDAASAASISCSLVGEAPAANRRWRAVIASEAQLETATLGSIDAQLLVVTRGSAGARVRSQGEWFDVPAARASVVDETGAGDVFAGVLLGELERGTSLHRAVDAAIAAAARCCEAWGAQATLERAPLGGDSDHRSRARGALWGLACGDAFGMPASFIAPATHRDLWPDGITDLLPGPDVSPYHGGYEAGQVTDDTEQAQALTRALVTSPHRLEPEAVARELFAWYESVGGDASLAVGPSSRRGLMAWRSGTPLAECGRQGTSNGASMRIAPLGVLHGLLRSSGAALLDDVEAACLVTHNTQPAISAATALASAVAAGVRGDDWHAVLAAGAVGARMGRERGAWVYAPDVEARIELAVRLATDAGDDAQACQDLARLVGTGEPSAEAVPAAFGIAARAGGDPRRALLLAANTAGDTDTIGAMAGALCGSWAGEDAVPGAWRAGVAEQNDLDIRAWLSSLETVAARRLTVGARS